MNKEETPPRDHVAVVGLGKIGLTLAAVFASRGFQVHGADISPDVVASVNQGIAHISNEPGLDKLVSEAVRNERLRATVSTEDAVRKSSIIVVIVPVLVDEKNETDYRSIDQAISAIGEGLQKGSLVIFETTLPPGDTRNRFGKKLEEVSGLKMGEEFYLAYSPERVYSNRIIQDLENYPKVIGGFNQESLKRAKDFYSEALKGELIEVSSLETAEFSKVAECVYRDVNIALANELAQFADEIQVDIREVIPASNSQPYSNLHQPGIGVGGHCIPVYPYFFINKGLNPGLTTLARSVNDTMANYSIEKIEEAAGSLRGKKLLILGLSYRENVKEPTKSAALLLRDQLKDKGARVFVHDPEFTSKEIEAYGVEALSLEDPRVEEIDIVILQAFHKEYNSLDFSAFTNCQLVFDGRNKLKQTDISNLNIKYLGIGNGGG